ncbi:low temperature requirement protein A [Glycomyces sp. NPDC048151]|uniref:low temperature requirement protein A n=1 Tax=Glycomyces sp. NPDC048151 TaxID=3364002 RepID=UPI003710F475
MTEQMTSPRHATWLELFFDLVVVAAVAQLTHLLEHPDGQHVAAFFILYAAIWLVWSSFTVYANVASGQTRTRTMLLGMIGLAAMAAAIPEATGAHAAVFGAAYIYTSGVASQGINRTGKIVLGWSAVQRNAGLFPFIVAFWFTDRPWVLLGLWALGVALTLTSGMVADMNDPERLKEFQTRLDRAAERRGSRRTLELGWTHGAHLGERLGLFIIIVLGEAVLQLVTAMGEVEWGWSQVGIGLAGFGLLIGLWWLNFRYGFDEENEAQPRVLLPAHLVVAVSITLVAFGLGTAAEHATDPLPDLHRWLLCGALALCLALCALANRAWWGLLVCAAPLAVAAFGSGVAAVFTVLVLAASTGGFVVYFNRRPA